MKKGYSKEDRKVYAEQKRKIAKVIEVLYEDYNFNDVPLSVLAKRYGFDKEMMRLAIDDHLDKVIQAHRNLYKTPEIIVRCECCGSIISRPK